MHLKLEYEAEKKQKDVLLDDVCLNYEKCIQTARDTDMQEICRHIYKYAGIFPAYLYPWQFEYIFHSLSRHHLKEHLSAFSLLHILISSAF